MFYLLLLLVTLQSDLCSDRVLLVPDSRLPIEQKSRYFKYTPPHEPGHVWQMVDKSLQSEGSGLEMSDLSDLFNGRFHENIKNIRKIIFCNIPHWIPDWKEKLKRIPKHKLILVTYEPPSVLPEMYYHNILDLFQDVLTWNDDYVDGIKYFKFNYPVLTSLSLNLPKFHERKLLTQISGNKTSDHRNELYSERKRVINFFERKRTNNFKFYGQGWNPSKFKNCGGGVQDKIATLKQYRFSISYENIKNIKGYVTEKIFDCFHAGTIPIYWGASNIKKIIPENCYVSKKDFSSLRDLYAFLKSINEDEYNKYLQNIRTYLQSKKAKQFSHESFADVVIARINHKPKLHE